MLWILAYEEVLQDLAVGRDQQRIDQHDARRLFVRRQLDVENIVHH
jgi:hypothetical protein